MAASVSCPKCGSSINHVVAGGECVRCLMQLAIDSQHDTHVSDSSGEDVPTVDELNDLLEDFDVLETLGRGGMGAVYKARQRKLDRVVAIKVPPRHVTTSPKLSERFVREAKALAKAHHPHVVTIFDVDHVNGYPFLVMEYIDGIDLDAHVRQSGPVEPTRAMQWMIQAAEGLEFAHRSGIIHRDVKPANLLLDQNGKIKILDLGLARLRSGEEIPSETSGPRSRELTQAGNVLGTIDYMSPEQAIDTRSADARSDIYSLGCTFHFLLTGKRLFRESSVKKILRAHRKKDAPSLRETRADIAEEIDHLYRTMVAKSPHDRPASMSQVAHSLRELWASAESGDSLAAQPVAARPAGENLQPVTAEPQKTNLRWRWLAGSAAVFLLFAFVVYRIETNHGVMVVRVDEAHSEPIETKLRDGGVELADQSGHRVAFDPNKETKLPAGVWQIRATEGLLLSARRNGVEVETQPFTIRRNDQLILEVTLKEVAKDTPPTQTTGNTTPETKPPPAERDASDDEPRWAADPHGGPLQIFVQHMVHPDIYSVTALYATPDDKQLNVFSTGGHAVMDLQKILAKRPGGVCKISRHSSPLYDGFYTPDGNQLTGLFLRNKNKDSLAVGRFDVRSKKPKLVLSTASSRAMDQSADGTMLAFAGPETGDVTVIDPATGDLRFELQLDRYVRDLLFSPTGDHLAGLSDQLVRIWDLNTAVSRDLPSTRDKKAVCFAADGKSLVAVGYNGRIARWDFDTGQLQNELRLGDYPFICVHLMKDGRRALIGDDLGTGHLVDLTTGETQARLLGTVQSRYTDAMQMRAITLTSDERYALTSSGQEHQIRLWRIPTNDELATVNK